MNTWCHLPTSFRRRHVLHFVALASIAVALTTTLLFAHVSHATPGTNRTVSFQGRLLSASGAVVADGHYNMEFKIYQDGSGTAAGNPDGTLKWTEDYVNNNGTGGIDVKNGFFSVNLGSVNPFGTSVDWSQATLWLSMNVAGSDTTCTTFGTSPCTADGEMLPMKQITATPYAISAGALDGKTADNFIQLAQGVQTDTSTNTSSIFINKTGTGNLIQLQNTASDIFTIGSAGDLTFGSNADKTLSIATAATGAAGSSLSIISGAGGSGTGATGGSLTLQGGAAGGTTGTGGTVQIDAGAGSGAGSDGVIAIGATHASEVSIGSTVNNTQVTINGTTTITKATDSTDAFNVTTHLDNKVLTVDTQNARVGIGAMGTAAPNLYGSGLEIQGALRLSGGSGNATDIFTTPTGNAVHTKINIPLYDPGQYGQILALGLPNTADPTSRVLSLFDARTTAHQPTLGVFSPDENNLIGFSWDGSNDTASVKNTGNKIALQGGGNNLLTALNNGGKANIGIGNNAASGYALDVTGDTNTSTQYRIGGATALTDSALSFTGASTSSVTSASGQSLSLSGNTGVEIQSGGNTSATFGSNVQIGTGSGTGTPTLLTIDKASTAPTISDTQAMLGSMYYDTTLGKVQCYEAGGWGSCGASPDSFVTISPEYSGAVMNGADIGTITSDLCSDTLNINDGSNGQPTICGPNETYNFYKWTTSESTNQTRSIYVTYQLPTNFKNFVAGSTSLMGRTDSANAGVTYQIYRDHSGAGLTSCGSQISVSSGAQTTWQKAAASGSDDPSSCGFTAGDSILFRINLNAMSAANAYVSNLNFTFSNN